MLDQEKFFNTYKVREAFEDSGLSWDTLEKIYEDYTRRLPEMKKIADRLQDEISKVIDFHVHSIHNRCKDPEHLIEKIIRKVGVEKRQKYKNINERNYLRIVRDLIGIRILILSKEEWRTVHDFLLKVDEDSRYDMHMAEMPRAYIRMGIVTFLIIRFIKNIQIRDIVHSIIFLNMGIIILKCRYERSLKKYMQNLIIM